MVRVHAVPVHPVLAVGGLGHLALPGLDLPAPALPALGLGVEPPAAGAVPAAARLHPVPADGVLVLDVAAALLLLLDLQQPIHIGFRSGQFHLN